MKFERSRLRPGDQLLYVTDYGKLNRLTGWKPEVSLRTALENMLVWFKKNRDLVASVRPPETSVANRPAILELERTA